MYISKEETKEIRNAFKKEFDSLTWLVWDTVGMEQDGYHRKIIQHLQSCVNGD